MQYDRKTMKAIGVILNMNKMDTVPRGEEGKYPNPLYSVWIYKDEIKSLQQGRMPESWGGVGE